MAKKVNEQRELVKRRYFESDGKCKLKDLAKELELPYSTVVSWKNRGGWDEELKQKRIFERNAKKNARKKMQIAKELADPDERIVFDASTVRKGVPPYPRSGKFGNQNAKGHGAPYGNKNALKHGLYESIKYKDFTEDEKLLLQCVPTDLVEYYKRLIAEYEIREKRMYARLEALYQNYREQSADGMMADGLVDMTMTSVGKMVTKSNRSVYSAIIATEEALTKLQDKKRAAINGLRCAEKEAAIIALYEKRYELELRKFEKGMGDAAQGITVIIAGEEELED